MSATLEDVAKKKPESSAEQQAAEEARRWWEELTARQPRQFAHWAWNAEFQNNLKMRRAE